MKKWNYVVLGAIALLAFNVLGSSERRGKKIKEQRRDLILDGSGKAKARARASGIQSAKHQRHGVEAAGPSGWLGTPGQTQAWRHGGPKRARSRAVV